MKRRILLTGGTGFIGRNLIPLLLQKHDVTLLVREQYGMGQPLPPALQARREQLQLVYADLRNYRLTCRAVAEAEADVVIHLAAAGATNPFLPINEAVRHNLNGTINLLRAACERRQIERVIVGRTPGEWSSMNVYAASKAAAWNFCEMFARTQKWPIVGAMIFQSYGYGQPTNALIPAAFEAAMRDEDFAMTAGKQRRDWVHVRDVAAGICGLVSADIPPITTIQLGTGNLVSVADVVRTVYKVSGSHGKPLVGALPSRPGEVLEQSADIANNPNFGWQAQLDLVAGLTHYFEQMQQAQS